MHNTMHFLWILLATAGLSACQNPVDLSQQDWQELPRSVQLAVVPTVDQALAVPAIIEETLRLAGSTFPELDLEVKQQVLDVAQLTIRLALSEEMPAQGFQIQGSPQAGYTVQANDILGWQYGVYELLERAGLVFTHPERPVFPAELCVACIGVLDQQWNPGYAMRGTHIHTMHPIEYERVLLDPRPENLDQYKRLINWLVVRRQNFLEWVLLRTVETDSWIEKIQERVDYAHERGVKVGIVTPFAFRQQNTFTLITEAASVRPVTDQIADSVNWLMQANWDYINVEMGAAEFLPVEDTDQVAWLSFLPQYLRKHYPDTRTATKVHASSDQFADHYDGINFNFIAKFADPGMGVMPHTVQWYDLYRNSPTYGRRNFHDMRTFLLGEIGKREVFYYPETAYWVTFDNDIPLFLPQYVYARWNDLHQLRGSGMTGQINFSSGFEWGFWLNDWSASWYAYSPEESYHTVLQRALAPLGDVQAKAVTLLDEYILWQGTTLLEADGIRWLIGWDAADEIGHLVGIWFQPKRVRLFEVFEMDAQALHDFVSAELPQLEQIVAELESFADRWQNLEEEVDLYGVDVYREVGDGFRINAVRASFMLALYRGVIALNEAGLSFEDGTDAVASTELGLAADLLQQGLEIVQRREPWYRFDHDLVGVDRPSFTSYPFGYLRTVTDLWYWDRELRLARNPPEYDKLETLYDLLESAGF